MKTAGSRPGSEWSHYLQLSEALLAQSNSTAQCEVIERTVAGQVGCAAQVWLAGPSYPLPGEPEPPLLPSTLAPDLVLQVYHTHQAAARNAAGRSQARLTGATLAALPITARDTLLGVLLVTCGEGLTFTSAEINYLEGLVANAGVALQIFRQEVIKNWRNEQLALVRQVSAQIANVLDLDELCKRVTRLIQHTFQYYYVAIFTRTDDTAALRFRASASLSGKRQLAFVVHPGEGIVGYVAETGAELLASDVKAEPRYRFVDTLPETRSELTLPLKKDNKVLGVLDIQSDQPDAFHEIDQLVLRSLADSIALAVEDARLYSEERRRAEQIGTVFEVSHALNSILDPDQLLEQVVQLIQKRFGYPYIHLYTVHPGRQKVFYRIGSGERSKALQEQLPAFDLNDPVGLIPWVARSGETCIANDVSRDPLYRPSQLPPYNTRAEMVIPLEFGGEVLGVLDVQSDRVNAFDEQDRSLLEALAASIAVAMRNANLYRSELWRRQVADSLYNVAGLLTANTALDTLLNTILTELERNLPCDASAIWLLDENGKTPGEGRYLRLAAVHGVEAGKVQQASESSDDVRTWLERALSVSQPNIRRPGDPFGPLGAALNFPPDYSSIAAPLYAGGNALGILTLAHHTSGRYGHESQGMTSTFASYAAVAIKNTRLYAESQEQAWVSTVLLQVSEATRTATGVDELLSTVVRLIPLLIGVKKCAAYVWHDETRTFTLKNWYGFDAAAHENVFPASETPALARLEREHSIVFVANPAGELNLPNFSATADGAQVLLPLMAHGDLLGALLVGYHPGAEDSAMSLNDDRLAILQGIVHQTSVALQNLYLTEASQQDAYVTAVLLQVAQAVVSQNDLGDILETIVHLMPILVGIDACLIYLWDAAEKRFRAARAFAGSHSREAALLERTYSVGEFPLLDAVFENDEMYSCELSSPDLPVEQWPNLDYLPSDRTTFLANQHVSNWLMGFPLSVKGEVYGALIARETGSQPELRRRRLEIINGVAQQAALAIQNDRLQQETVDRERLEREFQLARQIQQTFLPATLPNLPGWELDTRWQPARQVGGDFYDIFPLGEHHLGLVIADVSDKGMPAALYMTVTRTLIRANIHSHRSPAALLERVNRLLLLDSQNGMFITAVYAILDATTGELTYANAGHNRPLLVHGCGGEVETLPKGGIALGVLERIQLKDHIIQLESNDTLVFYTDGVTDNLSAGGEAFGEDRLHTLLSDSACDHSIHILLDRLDETLRAFRAGTPPVDDITLLGVRRLNAPAAQP